MLGVCVEKAVEICKGILMFHLVSSCSGDLIIKQFFYVLYM